MSSFRLYPYPPQSREPQEGNTATEGRIHLLESSLMVGPVQLSQSHWSTGWHGKWGDHTCATLCIWCPAWTKWCFLVLLKTLFVKYFKKSISLWGYKDSDCLIPLLKDSKPRELELWFQSKSYNYQARAPSTLSNYHFLQDWIKRGYKFQMKIYIWEHVLFIAWKVKHKTLLT